MSTLDPLFNRWEELYRKMLEELMGPTFRYNVDHVPPTVKAAIAQAAATLVLAEEQR